jgi:hypothetical protein
VITSSVRPSRLLTLCGYAGFVLIGWNAVLLPSLIRSIEHQFRQTHNGHADLLRESVDGLTGE